MREAVLLVICSLSSSAAADSLQAGYSADAGPAIGLDGRLGGVVGARITAERPVARRVSIGGGVDLGVAQWWDVGDVMTDDVFGVQLFGQVHVAIRLTRDLRLEPAAGFGAIHLGGDRVGGWLPAYGSSVAIVYRGLRAGIRSRIAIGDVDGFDPDTELGVFVGVQR
jgi:hypothetical protein